MFPCAAATGVHTLSKRTRQRPERLAHVPRMPRVVAQARDLWVSVDGLGQHRFDPTLHASFSFSTLSIPHTYLSVRRHLAAGHLPQIYITSMEFRSPIDSVRRKTRKKESTPTNLPDTQVHQFREHARIEGGARGINVILGYPRCRRGVSSSSGGHGLAFVSVCGCVRAGSIHEQRRAATGTQSKAASMDRGGARGRPCLWGVGVG